MKCKILLYGLQRSGTNFIENWLKNNFQVKFLNNERDRKNLTQKHFRLYDNKKFISHPTYDNRLILKNFDDYESRLNNTKKPDKYIVISKDPYSWFISYTNWAKKNQWPKVDFHYINEYNCFYRKWIEFSNQSNKIIFIRYFDILTNPEKVEKTLQKNKIQKRRSLLGNFFSKKINKVPQSDFFDEKKRSYYIHKEYLHKYDNKSLKDLNDELDYQVVKSLGYEVINHL